MGNNSPGKIRRQGREAFEDGYSIEDNPYMIVPHSCNHECWEKGWEQARSKEEAEQKELSDDFNLHEEIIAEIETCGPVSSSVSSLVMLLIKRGVLG